MNRSATISQGLLFVALMAALLCLAACDRAKAPEPLDIVDLPRVLRTAFAGGPADAKSLAETVAGSVEAKEWPKASVGIETLSRQAGLSKKQSAEVARCIIAINAQVQAAAEAGNAEANEVREIRRRDK
jgi:hypothetical protein